MNENRAEFRRYHQIQHNFRGGEELCKLGIGLKNSLVFWPTLYSVYSLLIAIKSIVIV